MRVPCLVGLVLLPLSSGLAAAPVYLHCEAPQMPTPAGRQLDVSLNEETNTVIVTTGGGQSSQATQVVFDPQSLSWALPLEYGAFFKGKIDRSTLAFDASIVSATGRQFYGSTGTCAKVEPKAQQF